MEWVVIQDAQSLEPTHRELIIEMALPNSLQLTTDSLAPDTSGCFLVEAPNHRDSCLL